MENKFIQLCNETVTPIGSITSVCRHSVTVTKGMPKYRMIPNFALVLNVEVNGVYSAPNETNTSFANGSTILITPNTPHHYIAPIGEYWDQIYIIFAGPIFDVWKTQLDLGHYSAVGHNHNTTEFISAIYQISEDCLSSPLTAIANLQKLIAKHLDACPKIQSTPIKDDWYVNASRLLTQSNLSIHEIAAEISMSYETFRKRFSKREGISALAYRNKNKAHLASIQLLNSTDSIAKIAERQGYYDESHFCRRFKATYNLTPHQYRKKYQSQD